MAGRKETSKLTNRVPFYRPSAILYILSHFKRSAKFYVFDKSNRALVYLVFIISFKVKDVDSIMMEDPWVDAWRRGDITREQCGTKYHYVRYIR